MRQISPETPPLDMHRLTYRVVHPYADALTFFSRTGIWGWDLVAGLSLPVNRPDASFYVLRSTSDVLGQPHPWDAEGAELNRGERAVDVVPAQTLDEIVSGRPIGHLPRGVRLHPDRVGLQYRQAALIGRGAVFGADLGHLTRIGREHCSVALDNTPVGEPIGVSMSDYSSNGTGIAVRSAAISTPGSIS